MKEKQKNVIIRRRNSPKVVPNILLTILEKKLSEKAQIPKLRLVVNNG